MGEFAVLAVVALFVLGPERLPGAIHWIADAARQAKNYVAAAKEQLNAPEFDELREPLNELREPLRQLRAADPRRALREALRGNDTNSTPAHHSPHPAASAQNPP